MESTLHPVESQLLRSIPGTRKLHAFIPLSRHLVAVKLYSNSEEYREEKVFKDKGELELDGL